LARKIVFDKNQTLALTIFDKNFTYGPGKVDMFKRFFIVALLCCSFTFSLYGDTTINAHKEVTQIWGSSCDENITFEGSGDISVVSTGESVMAAMVDANRTVAVKFLNTPSVLTPLTDLTDTDYAYAHIYAQTSAGSATGIDLANGSGSGSETTFSFVKKFGSAPQETSEEEDTEEETPEGSPATIVAYFGTDSAAPGAPGSSTVIGRSVSNGTGSAVSNVKLNLGDGNALAAHSESSVNSGTYSGSSSNVIGSSINSSAANSNSNVSNMELTLGNGNQLKAFSDGPGNDVTTGVFYASTASVIGSSCNNSYNGDGGNVCNSIVDGVIWNIGDYNNLEARAGGYNTPKSNSGEHYYGGVASVLGSSLNTNNWSGLDDGSLSQVSNLNLNIGNDNTMTARGSSCATVLGSGSNSINQGGSAEVTGGSWTIGNENKLTSYSGYASSVLGSSCNSGASNHGDGSSVSGVNWTIGNANELKSYSEYVSVVLGSSYKNGHAGGGASIANSTCTLGDENLLISSSGCAAAVFGASLENNGNNASIAEVRNVTLNIGKNNILAASSHRFSPTYLNNENGTHSLSLRGYTTTTATILGSSSFIGNNSSTIGAKFTFGEGNILTAFSCVSEGGGHASVSGVGASAVPGGTSIAHDITVNMNGSQTIAALAHSSPVENVRVNTFGADNTDVGDGVFGWRVGIFADDTFSSDSTVNILGANLAYIVVPNSNNAAITLGNSQGTSNAGYARAFALGNDFKIYVGGQALDNHEFSPVASNGKINVVNIIGAISKGMSSGNTDDSSLTVDSGWAVNTFGPVEDLKTIIVRGDSALNLYNAASNISKIEIERGKFHIGRAANFNEIIGNVKVAYVHTDGGKIYGGTDENTNTTTIVATDYPWNGTLGSLTLAGGEELILHVNSKFRETTINGPVDSASKVTSLDCFRQATGYVSVDDHAGSPRIKFLGGKIKVIDDNTNSDKAEAFKGAAFWIIRSTDSDESINSWSLFGFNEPPTLDGYNEGEDCDGGESVRTAMFNERDGGEDLSHHQILIVNKGPTKGIVLYPNTPGAAASESDPWSGASDGSLVEEPDYSGSGLHGQTPGSGEHGSNLGSSLGDTNPNFGSLGIEVELANINVASVSIFRSVIENRMTDVKGNGNDPFVMVTGCHTHRDETNGLGYNGNLGGIVGGLDCVCKSENKERYLRLGAAIGYFKGNTKFFGSVSEKDMSVKQDMYTGALLAAYESFSEKNLKTNMNLLAGIEHTDGKISRTKMNNGKFNAKTCSNNQFVCFELIKNMYRNGNWQIGPWVFAQYDHIEQKGYEGAYSDGEKVNIPESKFHFLDMAIGVNFECEFTKNTDAEFQEEEKDNKAKFRLFCKAGFGFQPIRKCSNGNVSLGSMLRYTSKHYALIIAGFRSKLDEHWDLVGAWKGVFSNDFSNNIVSFGVGYNF
jgi:hypothetical protein